MNFVFVILIGLNLNATAAETPSAADLKARARSAITAERYFDGQTISLVGLTLYSAEPAHRSSFAFLRAFALAKLGDTPEAHRLLADPLVAGGPFAKKIEFLDHWISLNSGDRVNFESWIAKTNVETKTRGFQFLAVVDEKYSEAADRRLDESIGRLRALETQSPVTNAVLSALIPGAGHVRLGRYQDAALTFALNFISIGATAELARKDLIMPAIAAGSLASLFYVGGISSAWRLTKERNAGLRSAELRNIERILFPELSLEF